MDDINKKNMVKEIMDTNNIFNLCDLNKLQEKSDTLLKYYDEYTPNKKRVVHNFLSNILHKKIISENDYFLLKSHVDIINLKIRVLRISNKTDISLTDTQIYIIDKVFLYNLKLDDSLFTTDKNKQDFRYKILFYLDKDILLSNYIKLYKSFNEIKVNDILYINNDFFCKYFVVKGFIMNNLNNNINKGSNITINKIILFTYNKNMDQINILQIPYFYFIGLNIKNIGDQIHNVDINAKDSIELIINLNEDTVKKELENKNNKYVFNSSGKKEYRVNRKKNGTNITRNVKLN
jgi:hypothetical protein